MPCAQPWTRGIRISSKPGRKLSKLLTPCSILICQQLAVDKAALPPMHYAVHLPCLFTARADLHGMEVYAFRHLQHSSSAAVGRRLR